MKTSVVVVDIAMDIYVARMAARGVPNPQGVRCATLAAGVGISAETMSIYLSDYRTAKDKKYNLGCRGYGTEARWFILGRPDDDPRAVQRARVDHQKYVASDAMRRLLMDQIYEVNPALRGTAVDEQCKVHTDLMMNMIEVVVNNCIRQLQLERRKI